MSCDDSNNAVYVSSNGELAREDRFGVDENKDENNL